LQKRSWYAGAFVCLIPIACSADEPVAPVDFVPVAENLERPVFVTHAGDGSRRLFIIEQPGRILVLENGELLKKPFLDISAQVESGGNEQGLLGLAFHPDFESNGRFFVNYTRQDDGATVVSELKAGADPEAVAASERVLLTIPQPYSNHNGGMIAFGPDGFLYVGMGDGGSGGDPGNRAQDPGDLLGKMLRIDVDGGAPYGIPQDNPFADGGGRPEIFALGLRNPWRFSFTRETGKLYAGDVGQNAIEEIDIVERGGNYGWRPMEGRACYDPSSGCESPEFIMPIAQYEHGGGRCSVTGGYVYGGSAVSELTATYVFGDYCSGEILTWRDGEQTVLVDTDMLISSFGEDAAGELYVVDLDGAVYRLEDAAAP
jgi:glucose/arabinose dehydrogenase